MDVLTHVFLPLLIAYLFRPSLFRQPRYAMLGGFGLFPDFDKLIGEPGLLHSVLTMVPVCAILITAEWVVKNRVKYTPIVALFILSHFLLDILGGGPVPLFYPFISVGLGFRYPMTILFGPGAGPLWIGFDGWPIAVHIGELRTGHSESASVATNGYGLINAYGVTTTLTYLLVVVSQEAESIQARLSR